MPEENFTSIEAQARGRRALQIRGDRPQPHDGGERILPVSDFRHNRHLSG
jgi:hypothetical protein